MKNSNRRVFLFQALSASTAVLSTQAIAQAKLEEKDPQAVALGYLHDTTKVDAKKYPQHKADQKCNNCQFWQGSATDAWAGCSMFGRKHIAAAGWCLAWKKVG